MKIENILKCLNDDEYRAFVAHLTGGTSSRQLADIMTRNGYSLGKTTINNYRKANGIG